MAKTYLFSVAALAVVVLAVGCDADEFKYRRGDVTLVKPGWSTNQVKHGIGKPDYCIEGEGLR
ncbi:MAG: hypothetical protein N3A66_06615, partial [Planctomycetota bacterium]|nr:hypothetical protein [Planctomycetota bacterium]